MLGSLNPKPLNPKPQNPQKKPNTVNPRPQYSKGIRLHELGLRVLGVLKQRTTAPWHTVDFWGIRILKRLKCRMSKTCRGGQRSTVFHLCHKLDPTQVVWPFPTRHMILPGLVIPEGHLRRHNFASFLICNQSTHLQVRNQSATRIDALKRDFTDVSKRAHVSESLSDTWSMIFHAEVP